MNTAIFALVLVLGSVAVARADPTDSIPGIVDMTPSNFDEIMSGKKLVIAEFYAPWCGHCKSLVPELVKLGEMLQADAKLASRVIFAKCNADEYRELGEKFDVKGFPTLKFFPRGRPASKDNAEDYNGARSATAFMEYFKQKVQEDASFVEVEVLKPIVEKFLESSDKKALIAEATTASADLEGDDKINAALYIAVMEKTVAKGDEYLAKEKTRLDKMLSSGNVAAAKADEMTRKVAIMAALLKEE